MSELKEVVDALIIMDDDLNKEYVDSEIAQYKREGMVIATQKILGWLKGKYEDSVTPGDEGEKKVEEGTEAGSTPGED